MPSRHSPASVRRSPCRQQANAPPPPDIHRSCALGTHSSKRRNKAIIAIPRNFCPPATKRDTYRPFAAALVGRCCRAAAPVVVPCWRGAGPMLLPPAIEPRAKEERRKSEGRAREDWRQRDGGAGKKRQRRDGGAGKKRRRRDGEVGKNGGGGTAGRGKKWRRRDGGARKKWR